MSRRKNLNIAGHAHELTFSCHRGFTFLKSDRTCEWLKDAIGNARNRFSLLVWAYVFMPNHVHLILFPTSPSYDIARIRSAIKEPVARKAIKFLEQNDQAWLDRITSSRGQRMVRHFWRTGGGYDRNIDNPATLWRMIDYVHLNPVRKGLVKRAVDWKWSSASWYEGGSSPLTIDESSDAWGRA